MVNKENTEGRILDAAMEVFIAKGFDGARMQEIADFADINKALLHYYFRSKDKLFEAVFQETLLRIGPMVLSFVNEPIPLEVKIWKFVDDYIEIIKNNPKLPLFILNEIHVNPDRVLNFLNIGAFLDTDVLQEQLNKETDVSGLSRIDVKHFVVNILSMTIFPFIGKPIMQKTLKIKEDEWGKFLEERKRIIPQTIMNWIKYNQKV
jgi:AcrR family transcriptional regulator